MEHYIYLGAAITIVLQAGKQIMPQRVMQHPAWVRTEPVTPLVLGVAGVALMQGALSVEAASLGLCVGGFSGHLYKLAKQTLAGRDARLDHDTADHEGAR